ncbi:Uncharacterised protein [Bacteroides heparinolyticus]|uniref:Uncharacterized protein n=1 Tax=Prevotella heparinolytica TaxID=28113 RepID=A0A449HZH6_9BACE|nr:Uncharacterised protein [Bacteroides heparinolyticus]
MFRLISTPNLREKYYICHEPRYLVSVTKVVASISLILVSFLF